MKLSLSEDSLPIKEMFERFFAAESTPARVKAAEPVGFDADLWRQLVELEAPLMRTPADASGAEMSLFDACVVMEEAGRYLASAPLAESLVALRLLGLIGGDVASAWLQKVRDGETVVTLALRQLKAGEPQLVPGGAVAKAVLAFDRDEIALFELSGALEAPETLGGAALGVFSAENGKRVVLASGADAMRLWGATIEEWKILTSSALVGLSQQAIAMAAAYATERTAFGQPIGVNQGLAHPLADDVVEADGARMYLWWTLRAMADQVADAAADVSLLFWFAAQTASRSVKHALHTFGGYGLTNEYDIQLYNRRAKAWPLVLGDPQDELVRGGRRKFLGETTPLPDPGEVYLDFKPPAGDPALAEETQALFDRVIDPKKHLLHNHSFDAHAWDVHRALGAAGLLYPDWPKKYGGREADSNSTRTSRDVWKRVGYSHNTTGNTGLVGAAIMAFGSQELQEDILPRMGRGEITTCLGYTEPSCGSDVFAAKTKAVRDGDHWVINGQKMFTSSAEFASYVFMIARTNPDAPKHKGITMFLVPMDTPGIEIHPVYTFMDERTNATFYSDVRIPDKYRVGEVDGGLKVLASALAAEQGASAYARFIDEITHEAALWAKSAERNGRPAIEDSQTLARLARCHAHARIAEALSARVQAAWLAREPDFAYGPASKVFGTEAFIADSADLLDLTAPDSLVRSKRGLGHIEMGYRHSAATAIYAGASEILRSMVAEKRLGLPRSRA